MSARKTGTPWPESCSAMSCSVFVLPVPVAPATRPCRLSVDERDAHGRIGMRLAVDRRRHRSAGPPLEGVARRGSRRAGRRRSAGVSSSSRSRRRSRSRLVRLSSRGATRARRPGIPLWWHGDLQEGRRRPPVSRARQADPAGLGRRASAAGAARRARHHEAHARPRSPARRGLHVLRRPVRPRRRVGGARSTSRTVCTARCVPLFSSDLPCTRASSCLTDLRHVWGLAD